VFQTPGGEFLGDAQNATTPGDTVDLSHEIARRLREPAPETTPTIPAVTWQGWMLP
jgi:hypothetical protein